MMVMMVVVVVAVAAAVGVREGSLRVAVAPRRGTLTETRRDQANKKEIATHTSVLSRARASSSSSHASGTDRTRTTGLRRGDR